MKIGIPKETKDQEGRVALTPGAVSQLVAAGHVVQVQADAGLASGFLDQDYLAAGALIVPAATAWDNELVLKVKEPLEAEYPYLQEQILFTFLHLSGGPRSLTEALLKQGTTGIAYETVEDSEGTLPLLAPMSAVAGNMAALVGAYYLGRQHGGKGVQPGQVLGTRHGKVLIIGDGVVAQYAALSAHGLGATVVMAGLDADKGMRLHAAFGEGFTFIISSREAISQQLPETDLVVGAVLRRGAKADYVVTEAQVKLLRPGSVVVDVSIDQGGCIETSRPTSHTHPIYIRHQVIHYCVTNMPGAYPRTSAVALSDAVLPYALKLANEGLNAVRRDTGFAKGLNTHKGYLTIREVAKDLDLLHQYRAYSPP